MNINNPLSKPPYFECEQCNKQFSQRSSRNRHIREQHLQPGLYKCKNCGIRFSKKFNLQMHQKHAHPKVLKKGNPAFKCSYCSCIFTRNSVLTKHKKDYHEKEQLETSSTKPENLNDPQTIAANVIEELKQLQNDQEHHDQVTEKETIVFSHLKQQEVFAIDSAIVQEITLRDNLYPLQHFTQHKVQIIKRSDGFSYYICAFCSKEFKKTYDYLRHRRIHTKIRPFICVLCKKSFPTQTQLKVHCATHKLHDKFGIFKRFYKCPKCDEGFASITKLDIHLRSHGDATISFECPECFKSFPSLKHIVRHKHYKDDKELNVLKNMLPNPLYLVDEEKSSGSTILKENQEFYTCSLCGFKLSSKVSRKQHERRHQNLFKYQCNRCKSSYVSQASLNNHRKIHLKELNIQCQVCSKNFYNNYQLERHQSKHSQTKNYKCQYCDKTFKTTQNCRSHMMTHLKQLIKTNEENQQQVEIYKNYPTIIEDFNKKNISTTNIHILTRTKSVRKPKEKDILKYKCLKCNKSFRYASWLRKHFKYKHTNETPYECGICLKRYRTKQILQNHILIHSAETKPKIFCQVCGKQYASDKSLKIHLRIHTNEKPFECLICNTKFRTSGHLIQHRKSHHHQEL